ncbi:Peptide synthetase [Saccharothrix espanaensis DSM 44229]|uniref:Peptide synthetase n=2 Tax=Saccharothrix espanaensis TaxID=103731 RepID=K0K6U9_SACES|nr:Peptide synthetase [Saccharothrix espanaensis DSM 44229]
MAGRESQRAAHLGRGREWNATVLDYPRDALVHELFLEQARATPEAIALSPQDADLLSYDQVRRRMEALAAVLAAKGVRVGDSVAVGWERSVDGDPLPPCLALADAAETVAEASAPIPELSASDLAYVMFTSGSIGTPKGPGPQPGSILSCGPTGRSPAPVEAPRNDPATSMRHHPIEESTMTVHTEAADLAGRLATLRHDEPVANAVLDKLNDGSLTAADLRGLVLTELQAHQAELVAYGVGLAKYPHPPATAFFTQITELVTNATPKLVACARALGLGDAELRRRVPDPTIYAFGGCLSWIAVTGSQASLALALHTDMTVYFPDCVAITAGVRESAVTAPDEFFDYYDGTASEDLLALALETADDGLRRGDDPDEAAFSARLLEANIGLFWRAAAEAWS